MSDPHRGDRPATLIDVPGEVGRGAAADHLRPQPAPTALARAAGVARSGLTSLLEREVVRFALVGLVNTALDLGIFFVLQLGGTPVLLANLLSTSAGLAFSFVANRGFTFSGRSSTRRTRQVALFVLCTGIGLWIVQPLVIFGMDHLLLPYAALGAWSILIAKCVAIGFGMVWNWTVYNHIVFRRVRSVRGEE